MEYQSIGQVSKAYGISVRMLRYYEQVGLVESLRNKDNEYRSYDEAARERVQQIILLRKLQIPVKQIRVILENPETAAAIDIFKESIVGLEREITALTTIKTILERFISEIESITDLRLNLDFLNEDSMRQLASLSLVQKNTKERLSMDDLDQAAQVLGTLRDVRVVYLPPMTVASIHCKGKNARDKSWKKLCGFVQKHKLLERKPDLRVFRFEYVNGMGEDHGGYEIWVSIPEDFSVPRPFVRKKFLGGQFAAHTIGDNNYETMLALQHWISECGEYRYDPGLDRCEPPVRDLDSFGGMYLDLEEMLDFYNAHKSLPDNQVDLLLPVKPYAPVEEIPVEIPGSKERCGFRASIVTKNKFRIWGFTCLMRYEESGSEAFADEIKADGRLDILNKYRKPGAPLLSFDSADFDAQLRGCVRQTFCLAESDITDVQAFMEHNPYVEAIDASKWLIFEHRRGDDCSGGHGACAKLKLGYQWNRCISGTFEAMPDGKIGKPDPNDASEMNSVMYNWYPVK